MKQTYNVGYLQTPSVKHLANVKQALADTGLASPTTPNEMLPDLIEEGVKKLKGQSSAPVDNGPIYEGKYRVRYFDVDGTVLKIEYVENGGITTPPDAPSYDPDYLIFDEWNYDIENYIVDQPTDIGAIYKTVNDVTYMWCRFTTKTGLNPTLAISGFTSIDWSDGTVDTNTTHTYNAEGNYIIKIYGDISFTDTSSKQLLGSSNLNIALKKCYIKKGVTSIGNRVFYSCISLESVTIPESVTSMGDYAFYSCRSLTGVTIPEGVTKIGGYAFSTCERLTSITIPEGVTEIDSYAFENCNNLKNIIIPESVTSIGMNVFSYCYNLTNINIPEGITTIRDRTFDNCRSLESVTIPESLKDIGYYAFSYCYNLTSVTIPKNMWRIGNYAFNLCYSLTDYFIDCDAVPTLSNTNAFNNINASTIMWVNDNIIDQLKTETNWSSYASYMKPLSWYPHLTNPNA